jgi:hypothetical protein
MSRVACVHCGQDWVRPYRKVDTGQVFHLCPECESVWLEGEDINSETECYLSEFLGGDDSGGNWGAIAPVD